MVIRYKVVKGVIVINLKREYTFHNTFDSERVSSTILWSHKNFDPTFFRNKVLPKDPFT